MGRESSRDSGRGGREDSGRSSRDEGRGSSRGSSRGGREESGRGSSYEYKARDAGQVKDRAKSLGGGDFDKICKPEVQMFTPNDGDNVIRILPPTWEKPEHYGLDLWLHYKVGPDEQTYLCLNKMNGEDCPVCEERRKAVADGDEDYADQLKPKQRVLIALIDRENEKDGVQVWSMPWGVDKDLLSRSVDKKTGEVLALDDPENGYDVEFERTGQGIKTKYIGLALARRESALGNSKWLDWIVDNPLPTLLQFFSYEHIAGVFGGASKKGKGRDRGDVKDQMDEDLKELEKRGDRNSRSSRSSKNDEPELSWDSIHSMTYDELVALIDDQDLKKIVPDDSKDDEELADWICEDLDIKKVVARRKVADDSDKDDSPKGKLAEMRRRREG